MSEAPSSEAPSAAILLYGNVRIHRRPEPKPEPEPSVEFAKKDGELRNLRSGTAIASVADLSALYGRLAGEADALDRAGWRVEPCKRGRRVRLVAPD